jgi:Predicted membrane protein (DUF2207) C-terminal domain/Predicted membrane protein (DUF2207) N-terminal domain
VRDSAAKYLLAAALLALVPRSAPAKDFYFPQVRIEVAIDKGGSFTVDEFRTFEFQGRFSYAYISIPLRIDRPGARRDVKITDLAVTDEAGRGLRTEIDQSAGRLTATWHYSAENERRTFHIRYRVEGGITSYSDVTELYWKIVGEGAERPARDLQVTVRLPEPLSDKANLLVWAHGPLAGWAEVLDPRTARFSSPDLAAGQYFEIRAVWPAGLVTGVRSDGLALAGIKAEEEGFVRDTIARVRRAQAESAARRGRGEANRRSLLRWLGVWGVWQIAGPLLWLLLFVKTWRAVGRDYRFEARPDYVRELPADRPPAVVQTLMREGREVTPAAFTATLFDLARRGVLEIEDHSVLRRRLFGDKEAVETSITLKKDPASGRDVRPFERSVLEFVYEDAAGGMTPGASLTVEDLLKYLKRHPQKFQSWYRDWTKGIKAETKPLGFLEPESVRARNRFYLFTLPAALLTLSPVLLILALTLIPTLKRRTMDWARENEDWKGLKRFLDDFSDFAEIPAEAYKLWEHYLVFGILFGNAKKILKMLPLILKDERAVAPVWYSGFSQPGFLAGGGLESAISSIQHAATAIDQASTSAAHYSSGGGGGFSGGGGGGGGGGGVGAG